MSIIMNEYLLIAMWEVWIDKQHLENLNELKKYSDI
jgi:hypothetical protein